MDEKFQDRIDDYLLNRMNDDEKESFLHEVEQDAGKKEQLEFTQNVKDSIRSREEKARVLAQFRQRYEEERKAAATRPTGTESMADYGLSHDMMKEAAQPKRRMWLWISGVAAVLAVGFFVVRPMLEHGAAPDYNGAPMENMRGGDDVFSPVPADSADSDTIKLSVEKEMTPDE